MVSKIHIIGGAGSGKATLAKKLGDAFAYPCYDLDTIAWKDHHKVSLETRLQAVDRICAQPAWITEGIFPHSTITNRSPALLPCTSGK